MDIKKKVIEIKEDAIECMKELHDQREMLKHINKTVTKADRNIKIEKITTSL
tara:strand:- start:105 stop:260 length:156 start_codon:yes stop_codon:yes gene_type:complete